MTRYFTITTCEEGVYDMTISRLACLRQSHVRRVSIICWHPGSFFLRTRYSRVSTCEEGVYDMTVLVSVVWFLVVWFAAITCEKGVYYMLANIICEEGVHDMMASFVWYAVIIYKEGVYYMLVGLCFCPSYVYRE